MQMASRVIAVVEDPARMGCWAKLDTGLMVELTIDDIHHLHSQRLCRGRLQPLHICNAVGVYLGLHS